MAFSSALKGFVENLPEAAGRPLRHVPYTLRLGVGYRRAAKGIRAAEAANPTALDAQRLAQLRALLQAAVEQVDFYREFYRSKGFEPADMQTLEDWNHVPVVTKADLQSVPLSARCASGAKGLRINTGGTTGQPLEFLLDRQAFAREWAHMHHLWKAHGYRPQHLKLTFRGKHFDRSKPLHYNAVHNELVVNANCPLPQVVAAVAGLPRSTVVRWLHGYPSLVAEFAHALTKENPQVAASFRERLFGVLLGSEYPAPVYRSAIEQLLSVNVVSWYGHSEMALLARETALGVYASLPTYGYAEAVPDDDGNSHHLVCTSLHNRVHPFIRYDTGDLIEPVSQVAGTLSFRISEGRVGDFVHDRQGNKLALTAIIFGRHHKGFELVQHLQVREDEPGRITLVITPRDSSVSRNLLRQSFDLSDLDIEWRVEVVASPIRTAAGKIRLKIH